MTEEMHRKVQTEFIKWGTMVLGALVVAGAASLANRDVYSKEQIDEKILHIQEMQGLQVQFMNDQLVDIKADLHDIKIIVERQKKGH